MVAAQAPQPRQHVRHRHAQRAHQRIHLPLLRRRQGGAGRGEQKGGKRWERTAEASGERWWAWLRVLAASFKLAGSLAERERRGRDREGARSLTRPWPSAALSRAASAFFAAAPRCSRAAAARSAAAARAAARSSALRRASASALLACRASAVARCSSAARCAPRGWGWSASRWVSMHARHSSRAHPMWLARPHISRYTSIFTAAHSTAHPLRLLARHLARALRRARRLRQRVVRRCQAVARRQVLAPLLWQHRPHAQALLRV